MDLRKNIIFINWYIMKKQLMSLPQLKEKNKLRLGRERKKQIWLNQLILIGSICPNISINSVLRKGSGGRLSFQVE